MIQRVNFTQTTSVGYISKELDFNFLNDFLFCVGISLNKIAGTFVNGKITIKNTRNVILKTVPFEMLDTDRTVIAPAELFIPVFMAAKNEKCTIVFEADSISVAADLDFHFLLTKESTVPEKVYNYQSLTYTYPGATKNADSKNINLDYEFSKCKGIALVSSNLDKLEVTLQKDNGETIVSSVSASLLALSNKIAYTKRLFPFETEAKGKILTIGVKTVRTFTSDDSIQIVLLLEK